MARWAGDAGSDIDLRRGSRDRYPRLGVPDLPERQLALAACAADRAHRAGLAVRLALRFPSAAAGQ